MWDLLASFPRKECRAYPFLSSGMVAFPRLQDFFFLGGGEVFKFTPRLRLFFFFLSEDQLAHTSSTFFLGQD